ncbi:MAG: DUF6339 family protein [Bacteroidaceae bacterium]|nr:DUF6339 family protein [Bacteroidaceae bacterium]
MAIQKVFTDRYIDILKKEISIDNYVNESFPLEVEGEGYITGLAGIEKPEGLEDRLLNAKDQAEEAIILYEAYENLTPFVASQEWLWTYLTHVDLMRYTKKRWKYMLKDEKGNDKTEEDSKKYIRAHWFRSGNGPLRTTVMELWWSVYISIDREAEDKYALTRVLFSNEGLRNRRLGSSILGRNREALKGILMFIRDNKDIFDSGLENRMIFISRHFNMIGGKKPLSYMKWDFFYNELESQKEHLKSISKREDVTGPNAYV